MIQYSTWIKGMWLPWIIVDREESQLPKHFFSRWSPNEVIFLKITDSDLPHTHYVSCLVSDTGDRSFACTDNVIKYEKGSLIEYLIPPSAFLGTEISNKLALMTYKKPTPELAAAE